MSILLESDRYASVQSHLDELTLRITILFISALFMTVFWSVFIDEILQHLLSILTPCSSPCLNVYDPAEWSAIRWFSAIFLSFLSLLPFIVYNACAFAQPGLLRSEYLAFRTWVVLAVSTATGLCFLVIKWGLPKMYTYGYNQHVQAGLIAQYDASIVLQLAIAFIWFIWFFIGTWLLLITLGGLGILTKSTSDWWRLRIYGLGSLLIISTSPTAADGLVFPLLAMYVLSSEWVARKWFLSLPKAHGIAIERYDEEGRRRKFSLVDCSCEGANLHAGLLTPAGCSRVSVQNLCQSRKDQESVLEHIMRTGITDISISGCDASPCSQRFKDNINFLNVKCTGLDLMAFQNFRIGMNVPEVDIELNMLAKIVHPETPLFEQRCDEILKVRDISSSSVVHIDKSEHRQENFYSAEKILVLRTSKNDHTTHIL